MNAGIHALNFMHAVSAGVLLKYLLEMLEYTYLMSSRLYLMNAGVDAN